ncbi:MAG: hypothetical protein QF643_02355 [Flavobacteriaceae bacterium]|nr:hypothetical protein [Flavobacteriaceae bacterium]
MHKIFLVLIFFSFPLIIFSQQDMTDEEILKGKEQLKKETEKKSKKKGTLLIENYKFFLYKKTEKYVDTSLTIYKDYKFNFLRKDNFELLSFANVGQTYNKLGHNFNERFKLPQVGARGKHFTYFEKEDIQYFNVQTPFTELFAKSTFEQGQILDALVSLNLTPEYNFMVAHKGYKSLGKYQSARARGNQFRFSSNYKSKNNSTIWRMHFTSQNIFNRENGGLHSDSIYFFEQAPDYFVVDDYGEPIINEDGSNEMIYYDGYLDRSRLGTMIFAENSLYSKRFYSDFKKNVFKNKNKESLLAIGYEFTHEYKKIEYIDNHTGRLFGETNESTIKDKSRMYFQENKVYLESYLNKLGELYLSLSLVKWDNSYKDYEEELSDLILELNKNQTNINIKWTKILPKISFEFEYGNTLKSELSSNLLKLNISLIPLKNINTNISISKSVRSPNFNFILFRSAYNSYNWYNESLKNEEISNAQFEISYKKLLKITADYYTLDNYTFFKENANSLNGEIDLYRFASPFQAPSNIKYYKIKLENHNKIGKFALINTVQYQKKEQNIELDELETLNVPEWLTRNTLLYSTDLLNKALFLQTGITFNYFTKFFADYYNPLLSELVTQNYKQIGDYPRLDFFINAKIQQTRIFVKVEHLNSSSTGYDFYSDPFNPYRDLSVRFGVVWNFFQ